MTELDGSYFIEAQVTDIHHTSDGVFLEGIPVRGNVPPEKLEEVIQDINSLTPGAEKARRLSVGFRKWRSSWDPHPVDPSLN